MFSFLKQRQVRAILTHRLISMHICFCLRAQPRTEGATNAATHFDQCPPGGPFRLSTHFRTTFGLKMHPNRQDEARTASLSSWRLVDPLSQPSHPSLLSTLHRCLHRSCPIHPPHRCYPKELGTCSQRCHRLMSLLSPPPPESMLSVEELKLDGCDPESS
jgi:hypothetical protein